MASSVSRLLLLGVLSLGGCSDANENANDGLSTAGTGQQPEAGSGGRWMPPSTAAAGKNATASAGSGTAVAGRPATAGTTTAQAGRPSTGAGGAGSPAAVSGGAGGMTGS